MMETTTDMVVKAGVRVELFRQLPGVLMGVVGARGAIAAESKTSDTPMRGKSGTTYAVDLITGGRVYVELSDLVFLE